MTGFLLDDVFCEIEHVLRDLHVLDAVEILSRLAHFVWIAQQQAHQAVVARLQRNHVLAVGQHQAAERNLVGGADGLANDRKGVVSDLAFRHNVIGFCDESSSISLRYERSMSIVRVELERDVFELLLVERDVGVGVDLVALDDVFVLDVLAGVGINLDVSDAVPGLAVDLVEADLSASEVAGKRAIGR